ncbi:TetR/AcrR family transcriptional regulator [Actinomadura roseirufa]|uniref:TetR/AcrR family transcriptional regulator n=1 Tax=Actinomadura roseirufa TaxID=2094049 RepID=UPI001041962E|nr:TetR/AcrR family transcriptional regulator [Actinomadura roseirufa]
MSDTDSEAVGSRAGTAPPRLGPPSSQLSARGRELLDELEALFLEEGFAKFTVAQLAARLRCSRRTLYELAPSKGELVLIVLDRRLRRFGRISEQKVAGIDDPLERIDAFLHVGASEPKRSTLRLLEDIEGFPAARRLMADHYRRTTGLLRELLEEGMRRDRVRPLRAAVVAEIIDAALDRLQDPGLLRSQGITYQEAVIELATLLRKGIEPQF